MCALLLLSFQASAEFTTVTRAYEIALSDFRVPATPSSGISFKVCADCEYITTRVTPRTRYDIGGRTVSLKEFRAAVFQIVDRAGETIIVMHHLESDTVTGVSASL